MTLSRTWYTRGNIPVADNSTATRLAQSILWGFKAHLKGELSGGTLGPEGARPSGANWTCVGSSDSVTAALDGTDRWLSTFDSTKLVRNTAGNAHSWILLQSPNAIGPYYICVDWSTSSDQTVTIVFAKTAFTGGTTTARPTSTGEVVLMTASNFTENVTNNYSLHSTIDANGNFFFHTSKNTSTIFNWTVWGQTLIEARGSDVCPFFMAQANSNTGRGGGVATSIASNTLGRTWNNGANTTGGGQSFTFGGSAAFNGAATANAVDSTFDVLPFYVYTSNANNGGIRGRFPDVGVVGVATIGASDPNTSAQERMVVGDFLIPSSVVPVL